MNRIKETERIKKEVAGFVRALHSLSETELEEYMQYIKFTTKGGRVVSVTMPPIPSEIKIDCEMILPTGENENERSL
jgi:hypothetical protein